MVVRGGFQGKLLDVDLTSQQVREVPLPPDEVLQAWVGGTGLGLYLLAGEIRPGMKTTDPGAPCLVMTGPLTGTLAPQSSNWTIINLRYRPDYVIGLSQAHGWFGARLKHAGWDGIILRGAASVPAYLWIDDGKVELRDASSYWGMDTYETPRRLKLELGDPLNISVACIGPGGENLILGASVRGDGAYTCAMGDAGMSWGSKKLKAIAVRGMGRVPIADVPAFLEIGEKWRKALYAIPMPPPTRNAFFKTIAEWDKFGGIPVRNFTAPEAGSVWADSLKEEMKKWKIRPVGSWQCEMACHHETEVTTGPLAGSVVSGFGSEVFEEVGPNVGIMDAGTSMAIAGLVDGLGIHSGEIPRTIAMMMEAYNSGRLTLEDADGLDLTWGNYQAVIELLYKTVNREGVGAIIAEGMRHTGQQLGIEDLAVHMHGVGFQGHDFRFHPAAIFTKQIASEAGNAPQAAPGLYHIGAPGLEGKGVSEAGFLDPIPLDMKEGIGEHVFKGQCYKLWGDCIGVCQFAMEKVHGTLELSREALAAATGWPPFTQEDVMLIGERLINIQRLINLSRGYKTGYDFDISRRLLSVPSGPAKGRDAGPHFAKWRVEYYQAAGWDAATGQPHPETLRRVGLAGLKVGSK